MLPQSLQLHAGGNQFLRTKPGTRCSSSQHPKRAWINRVTRYIRRNADSSLKSLETKIFIFVHTFPYSKENVSILDMWLKGSRAGSSDPAPQSRNQLSRQPPFKQGVPGKRKRESRSETAESRNGFEFKKPDRKKKVSNPLFPTAHPPSANNFKLMNSDSNSDSIPNLKLHACSLWERPRWFVRHQC
jgi:RNA recognition motif-containing protein